MSTYNYTVTDPAITVITNGAVFNTIWSQTNGGPATLQINDGTVYPIVNNQLNPLIGGELVGVTQLIFNNDKFILIGSLPIILPGSITGNQLSGGSNVNLIPDPLFQHNTIYWDFSRAGSVTIQPNLPPSGISGLEYVGTGAASTNLEVISAYIAVTSGTNYVLSGYIDSTYVTGTTYPEWLIKSTDLVTTYATAAQVSGVSGITSTTFQFPNGVNEVAAIFSTNNCVVQSGKNLIATTPQLEFGTSYSSFKTSYTKQPTIGPLPVMFGAWTNSQLNGSTPSSAPGGSITNYGGGTGTDAWTSTAYSGNNGLLVTTTSGGTLVANTQLGINYTITGAELFSFYALVEDNTPDQIGVQLYTTSGYTDMVYWGVDKFQFVNDKGNGPIPISKNFWTQFVFAAQDINAAIGTSVSGIAWGVWNSTNTTNIVFSDFSSSYISDVPNLFINTPVINNEAITAPAQASLTTPILCGGALAAFDSTNSYSISNIIIDSNGNGEVVTNSFISDIPGLISPSSLFGHFNFIPSGVTTPSNLSATDSSTNAVAFITALTPSASGIFPDIVNIEQSSNTSVSSFTIDSGSPISGQLIVVTINFVNGTSIPTITAPSGFTALAQTSQTQISTQTFYKIAGASEPSSYTFSFSLASTNYNAALFLVEGASGVNTSGGNHASSVSAISPPAITPSVGYTLCLVSYAFLGTSGVTPPAFTSTAPAWNVSITGLTQNGPLIWENIGPAAPYDEWLDIASVTLNVNAVSDIVELSVTDTLYAISNIGIGDQSQIRFITGNTVLAQGMASISASTTSATSSGTGSGILINKRATGLSGSTTITAQIRALNGSGNGTFAIAMEQADVDAQDYKK